MFPYNQNDPYNLSGGQRSENPMNQMPGQNILSAMAPFTSPALTGIAGLAGVDPNNKYLQTAQNAGIMGIMPALGMGKQGSQKSSEQRGK